jgi:hypothetical protein
MNWHQPQTIGASIASTAIIGATAAAKNLDFAGAVDVVSISARNAWMKTYGACPATPSPGSARTAGTRMDLAISDSIAARPGAT